MIYRLPHYFYGDHVSRDLPAGWIVRETKKHVFVELTTLDYNELLSDADFYWDQRQAFMDSDPGSLGLVTSARATATALRKQGAPA